jgi:predicted RNA-binding protein
MSVLDTFGRLEDDAIEFIDLNKDILESNKVYEGEIKRCDNLERKIK